MLPTRFRRSSDHRPRLRRRRVRIAGIAVVAGVVALAVAARWLVADLPAPGALVTRGSPDTTKIYDRHGTLLFEVLDPHAGRRTRVALEDLPPHVVGAVIAVEDAGYYRHPGVDVRGVARAAWHLLRHRRIVSGGSTITQQLARELLMDPAEQSERSARRKAREMVLALRITRAFDKDAILEMYLNEVYFGQLAYGIEAAAATYFGKPARELDLAEAALLAGLIQSPAAYNPLVDVDAARARQRVVLDLMVRHGRAGREAAHLAAAEPLRFTGDGAPLVAPHFVTWVREQLEARYGPLAVHAGGLHVVTSLDLDLQRRAEAIVATRMAELQRPAPGKPDHHASSAALVALDPSSGQVWAMVGSADYGDAAIDGAVNVALARRQPGSSIKPITYAAAFGARRPDAADRGGDAGSAPGDRGGGAAGPDTAADPLPFTPATVLSDVPTAFLTREGEPYQPMNYDRMWHGPISLRRALATSSNLVAVKVLDAVGLEATIDTAEALGITTLGDRDRYGLALTLGGGEVRLIELTAAFGGLANGGRRVMPNPILAVLDAEGFRRARADGGAGLAALANVRTIGDAPVVDPRVAWLVTDILADDQARLPAFGEGSVLAIGRPAAAKTGTTTDFRDNWTVGYTPDLAVGVWVGNADNSPMAYISGITGAGPIWHDVMQAAHRGRPARPFVRPDGLVRVEVCTTSGRLPTSACQRRAPEWFIAGTEPRTFDTSYRSVAIDAATGLAWAAGCAGPRVERVFRSLPPDAQDWGRQAGIRPPPDETCLGQAVAEASVDIGRGAGPRFGDDAGDPDRDTGAAPALVVTRPAPRSTFALTAQLPERFQRIELAARPDRAVRLRHVELWVDGRPIATVRRPPYRALWPLALGDHTVEAVGTTLDGRQVRSAAVEITVHPDAIAQAAPP